MLLLITDGVLEEDFDASIDAIVRGYQLLLFRCYSFVVIVKKYDYRLIASAAPLSIVIVGVGS